MIKKIVLLIFVLLVTFFLTGCFNLDIQQDVDYPAGRFQQTLKKIDRIHAQFPGRKGKVTNMNFLIYNGDERMLVSFSVPIETTKQILNAADLGEKGKLEKYTKAIKDIDIDLEKLKDFERIGPGLLVEAQVMENDDEVHVLIWLD